jgi:hypothetical protein
VNYVVVSLLLAQTAASGAESAPIPELLHLFRSSCASVSEVDQMIEGALELGWERVESEVDDRLRRQSRAVVAAENEVGRAYHANFRKVLAGRKVYLNVSRYVSPSGTFSGGCRVYDFDAAEPIGIGSAERWMARPATKRLDLPGGAQRLFWEPGWNDLTVVTVNYVPQISWLVKEMGLSGVFLSAQNLGK